MEAVIPFEPDMEAHDVGIGAAGAERGKLVEPGDGVAHADAIEFPGERIPGTGFVDELLALFHRLKIRNKLVRHRPIVSVRGLGS